MTNRNNSGINFGCGIKTSCFDGAPVFWRAVASDRNGEKTFFSVFCHDPLCNFFLNNESKRLRRILAFQKMPKNFSGNIVRDVANEYVCSFWFVRKRITYNDLEVVPGEFL